MAEGDADGVLITGVYGTGKSALVEEIAHVLEVRGVPFGAMDLDWLAPPRPSMPGLSTTKYQARCQHLT